MDAVSDDLFRPLGLTEPPRRLRLRLPAKVLPLAAVAITSVVVAIGLVVMSTDDPSGGEPTAVSAIATRSEVRADAPRSEVGHAETPASKGRAGERASASEVETASGVSVVRAAGPGAPSEAVMIRVPDGLGTALNPAPDARLVERSKHGPLPRLGKDGSRALAVYARPPGPERAAGGARIALVVTGLGIGRTATAEAMAKLPSPVTLAFAPYGADLEAHVAQAREAGHEVMLQVPMEPFDYPDNDPGPHTLLTDAKPAETRDRLHWIMSRFTGYIGIVNFMGAKLMADEAALTALLKEAAGRGLGFVDDGSSPRSLADSVGPRAGAPTARAEAVIDAVPRGDAIDRELARLEGVAKAKGVVVGSASALPLSVERIARWSRTLEAKGIRLVPVSSVLLAGAGR